MNPAPEAASRRVALLFTRFPVATETFLQREVEALRELGLAFDAFSLWPPPAQPDCVQEASDTFRPWHLLSLFFWIPYWGLRRPAAMTRLAWAIIDNRYPDALNIWETLLGLGYAVARAHRVGGNYAHIHAVWASAPATAAWALEQLIDCPYSMAGHAYDLYENGGDGLLHLKIPGAAFIRTSSAAGRRRWTALGAATGQVHIIRRGLTRIPPLEARPHPQAPYRILAVGRLVEKMGHRFLMDVLRELDRQGLDFRATIIGGGPLMPELLRRCASFGLSGKVVFTGSLPYAEVEEHYRKADLFLFGGRVARSGDRAGFPNVIGEAMAWGVPACCTAVGAVTEGIKDGTSGLIFSTPADAAAKILALFSSPDRYTAMRRNAHDWVRREFDARRNMRAFIGLLKGDKDPS